MFVQHRRNRRAVDRANMSSDYQKERPSENQGRQINTTAHKHRPMCEQLGFGRLARIVKDTQFDPRCLRRTVNIRRPGMGNGKLCSVSFPPNSHVNGWSGVYKVLQVSLANVKLQKWCPQYSPQRLVRSRRVPPPWLPHGCVCLGRRYHRIPARKS